MTVAGFPDSPTQLYVYGPVPPVALASKSSGFLEQTVAVGSTKAINSLGSVIVTSMESMHPFTSAPKMV